MNQAAAATMAASSSPNASVWIGRILSGIVIAFFLLDAAMKVPPLQPVIDAMAELGWPNDAGTTRALAVLMIVALLLYCYRPTSLVGAILMTAYLGGAVATHARLGSPLFTHTLFGVYVGVLAWAGLWLRDPQLRAMLQIRAEREAGNGGERRAPKGEAS
jgi:hypothetical protein